MKRIREVAATILLAASFVVTPGVCEAREGPAPASLAGMLARVLLLARQFVSSVVPGEPPSSALPITSWGQIKDKYRDPVGPIKN